MTTTPTCPDESILAALLAGRLPAHQAELHEPHLAHCKQCLARAEQLGAQDDLLDALRDTEAGNETAPLHDEPLVDDLVARLSGLSERAGLRQMLTEDELRSILGPAEKEDELGRLGKHRVTEVLGVGGMGVVFKAEDTELGRTVAVKVMKPQLAAGRDACRRFQREASAIAAFEHCHVVTVYHVGEAQGMPYFSMQLLEGESLRTRIEREGRLSPREVLRIGREIASGLHAAHSRGLLHRDIKPDNVWLESDADHVRIVDFGLARAVDQSSSLSQSGAILGTPRYMAPEQIRGDDVDQRCDLFSLGSLLFHAATGEPAFTGNNLVATLVSVAQDEVVPPHRAHPGLPRKLSDLIVKLLEKDQANRIQTAQQVVEDIEKIESDLKRAEIAEQTPRKSRSSAWLAATAVGLSLAAAAVLYVVTNQGTLVINADDSVALTIEQGSVSLRDRRTGREYHISVGENPVRAGVYEIIAEDKEAGLHFSSREFSILRGEKRAVTISLRPEPPPSSPGAVAGSAPLAETEPRAPPAWLRDTEDTLGIQAGEPLSALSLVERPAAVKGVTSWTVEPVHHRSAVNDVAFSLDATLVATAGQDGTLRVWDTETRQLQRVIVCPGEVRRVAWSGDGQYLASAQGKTGTGSICIWELTDDGARLLKKLNRSTNELAWSPDSSLLAFQEVGVQFWELESGEILPSRGVEGRISRRPWSADGSMLATSGVREGILLYEAGKDAVWKQVGTIGSEGNGDAIWSRTGAYIATLYIQRPPPQQVSRSSARPCYVEVWDAAKQQRLKRFNVGAAYAGELSWSSDESTVACGLNDGVSLWDIKNGTRKKEPWQFKSRSGRRSRTMRLDWAAVGSRVATLVDGQVALWDPDSGEKVAWTGTNEHVRFDHDDFDRRRQLLATVAGYESTRSALWDLKTLQPRLRFEELGWQFSLSPNGRRVAAWKPQSAGDFGAPAGFDAPVDLEVRFFDLPETRQTGSLKVRLSRRPRGLWSPNSKLLALYCDQHPHAVVSDGTQLLHTLGKLYPRGASDDDRAQRVAWSPDSEHIVWNPDSEYSEIVASKTGDVVARLTIEREQHRRLHGQSVVWSPDGKRIARAFVPHRDTNKVAIWDLPTPLTGTISKATNMWAAAASHGLEFSPNGQYIAAASSHVSLWDTRHQRPLASIRLPVEIEPGLEWLADNRHIAFAGVDVAGLIDLETRKIKYQSHESEFFLPTAQDGNVLAVGWSNHVTFYDEQLSSTATLVVPTDPGQSLLAVQDDGSYRISASEAAAPSGTPRIVALCDGVQRTYLPNDFRQEYDWQNEPRPLLPDEQPTDSLDIAIGDPLSPFALAQEPAVLPGVQSWTVETRDHRAEIYSLQFSPGGELLATAAGDGTVRIWDTDLGSLQRIIVCPGELSNFAWSFDGTRIATCQFPFEDRDQGTICIWDVTKDVKLIRKINQPAYSLSWSPAGNVLAGWYAGKMWLWDETSRHALTTNETDGYSSSRPWSPDGSMIAISNSRGIEIWETGRPKLVKTLPADQVTQTTWTKDGASIACLRAGLFNEGGENVQVCRVEIWDVESGERQDEITVSRAPAAATRPGSLQFALSPDESMIAAAIEGRVELWNRKTRERIGDPLVEEPWTPDDIVAMAWSPDSGQLAYLEAGEAHLWNAATKTTTRLCGRRGGLVVKQTVETEGAQLLLTESLPGGEHTLWNLTTAEPIFNAEGKEWQVSLSPTGETVALMRPIQSDTDQPISVEVVLHTIDGAHKRTFTLGVPLAPQLIWAPNGDRFALVNSSFAAISSQTGPSGTRLARQATGGFVTVVDIDGSVILEQQGELVASRFTAWQRKTSLLFDNPRAAWSPDSKQIAWWKSGRMVAVTDVATNTEVYSLEAPLIRGDNIRNPRNAPTVNAIAWSNDGQRLAWLEGESNRAGRFVMWSLAMESPELLANTSMSEWRNGSVAYLAFSADNKYVLTVIGSLRLDVWSAVNGRKVSTVEEKWLTWASWLAAEPRIVSLSGAGRLGFRAPAEQTTEYQPARLTAGASGVLAAADSQIILSRGRQISVRNTDFSLQSTWAQTGPRDLIGIHTDGRVVSHGDEDSVRVIVFADNEQRMMTRDEFLELSAPSKE